MIKFTTGGRDEDGASAEVELAVKPPSAKARQAARIVYAKAYGDAVDRGVKIKQQIDGVLRQAALWNDDRKDEYDRLLKSLRDGELRLDRGDMELAEARELAIAMSRQRNELRGLLAIRSEVENNTADAIAEQAMFNHYVASCTVRASGRLSGRPYFTSDGVAPSVDVYLERGSDPDARDAAAKVGEMLYGSDESLLREIPENKFLIEYGFVDDELNFVDEDGKRVDDKGRPVDEDGFLLDEEGHRIDQEGRRIDANGKYVVEFKPFLKDGKPVDPRRKRPDDAP